MLNTHRAFIITSILVLVSMIFSACVSRSTDTPTATQGIPVEVLTEVAATLIAGLPPTAAQINAPAPTATSTATIGSTATPTSTATSTATNLPPTVTASPTPTNTSSPTATRTRIPTFTASPTQPTATFTLVPSPTATRPVSPGTHFVVDYVNLPNNCLGPLWAIFAIYNNGTSDLESLSLMIYDATARQDLVLPEINNTPFMLSDKICAPGNIDTLQSGKVLYIGASLGSTDLSLHTLRATIEMCNGEGMSWPCYKLMTSFVVP